jgi:DNA-binding MarR family transcriptional regulator
MDARPRPETANTVPQALGRLRAALNASFTDASRMLELTPQQAELLCAALRPRPVGDLARVLHCDRSNVSRMVDRAVTRCLIERHGEQRDGRVSMIALTPTGQRLATEFIATLESLTTPLLETWAQQRQLETARTLNELASALEATVSDREDDSDGGQPAARPVSLRD